MLLKVIENPEGNFKLRTTKTAGGILEIKRTVGQIKPNSDENIVMNRDVWSLILLKLTTTKSVC
jgi:hypothetical protein